MSEDWKEVAETDVDGPGRSHSTLLLSRINYVPVTEIACGIQPRCKNPCIIALLAKKRASSLLFCYMFG